jgi:hypothetical protein
MPGLVTPDKYVTSCGEVEQDAEDCDQKERHDQPGRPTRLPFFFMGVLVWLVAHQLPLMQRLIGKDRVRTYLLAVDPDQYQGLRSVRVRVA